MPALQRDSRHLTWPPKGHRPPVGANHRTARTYAPVISSQMRVRDERHAGDPAGEERGKGERCENHSAPRT